MISQLEQTPSSVSSARASDGRPHRSSAFFVSPAVAALYVILGLATLQLGQMTGLAAPVWPAAGVAFAAALRWRWRALPGVFIGSAVISAVVNVPGLARMGATAPRIWLIGSVVGIGATLGAAVGAALVRRFVGPVGRLDTPRTVLLTLALSGLLASTIAPTFSVAVQLATGLLGPDQAALAWLGWWVGDSIGIIVIAPTLLMLRPSQSGYWSGRRWKIAVPSLLILGILMVAVSQNIGREKARIDNAVERLSDQAGAALAGDMARHQDVLEGLRGLAYVSDNLTAKEFDTYTADVRARSQGLQALSWDPLVTEAALPAFEARQRSQLGLENFIVTERDADGNLRPVSPRPEYVVVAYITPIAENRSALGFDIHSEPIRAAAIDTARDTGRPTATAPVDLIQEVGAQKGMLALLPVYEGGSDPGNETARRAALRGFAVGAYRLSDLISETFGGRSWDSVALTLVDVTDRAHAIVIADLPARSSATHDQVSAAPVATTSPLDVYGRTWELIVRPTSGLFTENRTGLTVFLLLAALAVTFLLEAFLLVLSGMDALARRLVSELGSAARYVTSILPRDSDAPVPVDSLYIPSQELGGDTFDHRWIDDDHLIVYLLDVSGHGIAPAMFSVSVHNLLRSGSLDNETLRDPGRVLTELNRLFQMDRQAENYFTIWFGVYQPSTRTLRYAGAGHPPAIVLTADGSEPIQLPSEAPPIAVLEDTVFETQRYSPAADTTLLLYSDGAFELTLRDGRRWTIEDLIDLCARTARSPHWTLEDLLEQIRNRSDTGLFEDDCTLVRLVIT